MQITDRLRRRVEVLAASHFGDWRIGGRGLHGRWSNQDFWLVAQRHVRNLGDERDELVTAVEFIERVRAKAQQRCQARRLSNLYNDGPNQDFDKAWLDCLIQGSHLKNPIRWANRSAGCRAASVCFMQGPKPGGFEERMTKAFSELEEVNFCIPVFYLQGLGDVIAQVDETSRSNPRVFCVAIDSNDSDETLGTVIRRLHNRKVNWRANSDLLCRRRSSLSERYWANESAVHWPPSLAMDLAVDVAMN